MTTEKEMEILSKLKQALINVSKLPESEFGSLKWRNSKKQEYYLHDWRKNLYEIPNADINLGTGREAVRSSAAMIFNLLGQKDFIIGGKKYTSPDYETKFEAIETDGDMPHVAHLDATFYSKDEAELHAVEAKLLEWANTPKNLSPAYLNANMYFERNHKSEDFISFFKTLIDETRKDSDGRFLHKTKKYDAIQMTIHILAIYNYICKLKDSKIKKIVLHNIVWKYDCEDYKIEESEGNDFVKEANQKFQPIFKELGVSFEVKYETFQGFKKLIDFSGDEKRIQYLKRYEI